MSETFSVPRMDALLAALAPSRSTRVMDIGANPINGATPYEGLLQMGACEVWGFEPQSEAFDKLMKARSDKEHYLNTAIGDGTPATLHICQSDGFTSLLPPDPQTLRYLNYFHGHMKVVGQEEVATQRLDDLDNVPAPDLLKIDVQGSELAVFEHGKARLAQTMAIVTEVAFVPLYEGQPLFHDQSKFLHDQGFGLTKFLFLKARYLRGRYSKTLHKKRHKNQLIDGDAVFVRSLASPDEIDSERLKHLAICADGIFDSHDLTLRCLELLIARGDVAEDKADTYARLVPFLA